MADLFFSYSLVMLIDIARSLSLWFCGSCRMVKPWGGGGAGSWVPPWALVLAQAQSSWDLRTGLGLESRCLRLDYTLIIIWISQVHPKFI